MAQQSASAAKRRRSAPVRIVRNVAWNSQLLLKDGRSSGGDSSAATRPLKKKARRSNRSSHESRSSNPAASIFPQPQERLESRYEVLGQLGRGRFGSVFACEECRTGEGWACKSIDKQLLKRERDVEEVRREVAVMRVMAGEEGVVQLKEVVEEEGAVHIVMERCCGGDLFDAVQERGCLTEGQAAALLAQIVRAVARCHERGVLHRDVKPENILLTTGNLFLQRADGSWLGCHETTGHYSCQLTGEAAAAAAAVGACEGLGMRGEGQKGAVFGSGRSEEESSAVVDADHSHGNVGGGEMKTRYVEEEHEEDRGMLESGGGFTGGREGVVGADAKSDNGANQQCHPKLPSCWKDSTSSSVCFSSRTSLPRGSHQLQPSVTATNTFTFTAPSSQLPPLPPPLRPSPHGLIPLQHHTDGCSSLASSTVVDCRRSEGSCSPTRSTSLPALPAPCSVRRQGQLLKLADFGLSVLLHPGQCAKGLAGTPFYMAPEIVRGEEYDFSADMWSVGVILYILLSGSPPFWGSDDEAIFGAVLKGEVDFSAAPWPSISPQAKAVVKGLLKMKRKERMTAEEVLRHPWMKKWLR